MVTMTPPVRAIYKRLLNTAKAIGPFTEDPKKTSIHLTRRTAFAGIATRKERADLDHQIGHRHQESKDLQARAGVGEQVAPRSSPRGSQTDRRRAQGVAESCDGARGLAVRCSGH